MFGRKNKRIAELENQVSDLSDRFSNEVVTLSNVDRLSDLFGASKSATGVAVTEQSIMRVSAVYASVRIIASSIASLPMKTYRRNGDGTKTREQGHPVAGLLSNQPLPKMIAMTFWECVVASILLHGPGYAWIRRTKGGEPVNLMWLHSRQVSPQEDGNDRLKYDVILDDGSVIGVQQEDMLHFTNIGWSGCKSLSTISSACQTSAGIALAADEYSAKFFANDSTPPGLIKAEKKMSQDQADLVLEYWDRVQGGADNRHKIGFLPDGMDFQQIALSAKDTQLLESRRFQVEDIARIFGVPPHMIGATDKTTSWGTGIEQQSIGFVQYTLRPHLTRIEQEVNRKLFKPGYFAEFDVNGLLRGDIKGRFESYRIALGGNEAPGWMSPNDVRKLENQDPEDGLDEIYKPSGVANEKQPITESD